jgi:hypothetical protein
MCGIADNRLVITIAPHNDICPHGAVAMVRNRSTTPTDHAMQILIYIYIYNSVRNSNSSIITLIQITHSAIIYLKNYKDFLLMTRKSMLNISPNRLYAVIFKNAVVIILNSVITPDIMQVKRTEIIFY